MTTLRFVEGLRELADGVEVVLSDIWGVVHNGLEAFAEACEALRTCRVRGATVEGVPLLAPSGRNGRGGANRNPWPKRTS